MCAAREMSAGSSQDFSFDQNFIQKFLSNREHVEQCVRNTTTMKKHSCIYKGCPDPNVVDLCPSRQEKCWPEPESKKGYECVENCHKVNCTDVEECNKDTGVCEYKGCMAGKVR